MSAAKHSDVFVSYELMLDDSEGRLEKRTFETPRVADPASGCQWDYARTHVFGKVTDQVVDYLSTHNLCFEVRGRPRKEAKPSTAPSLTISEAFLDASDSRSAPPTNDSSNPASMVDSRAIEEHNFKVVHAQQPEKKELPAKEPQRPKDNQQGEKKKKSKGFLSLFGL